MTDEQLAKYRSSIDNIDAALVHLLAERFKITQDVGRYKASVGLPAADLDREAQQVARLRALAIDAHPFAEQPPASYRRHATWVEPELVARIEIAELTNDGYVRHASFLRLVE